MLSLLIDKHQRERYPKFMGKTALQEKADNQLYTAAEVARWLKVSEQTLANWRYTGEVEIPFVRLGRSVKYRHADIVAHIEGHTYKNTTEAGH